MASPESVARQVASLLARRRWKLVLAESCTAGEAASLLGRVPGISQWWCGSCVTYRPQAKALWLKIPPSLIDRHSAESAEVTEAMACAVLAMTPEAELAGAITGHLGPDVSPSLDGTLFAATVRTGQPPHVTHCRLDPTTRRRRQVQAAQWLFEQLIDQLR